MTGTSDNLRWLYAGRALRSLSTAFLTVVFPLYLAQSGYDATAIGLILSLSAALNILLVAAVGLLADRYGRRTVLIGLSGLSAVAGLMLTVTPAGLPVLVLASGLGGVGRGGGAGSGGGWGPVLPVEQPLVAASARENSTAAFGRLSFIGVMASAVGSLIAGLPAYLVPHGIPLAAGYRLLFGLSGALSVGIVAASMPIRDLRPEPSSEAPPAMPLRQLLGRLGLTNALNGFGFGFLGPLLTYWFYRRYGMDAAELAVLYMIVNLVTAVPYLASSLLVKRLGQVRTVVVTRIAGVAALAAMPFMPSAAWAGAMYALRMGLNSLGMPARQSFSMDAAQDRHRSRVAAFTSLPSQATSMISPAIGGAVMDEFLNFPIFGAAFFMLLNGITYYIAFAHADEPPHADRLPPGPAPGRSA